MKKYHYLILFLISFFILSPFVLYKLYDEHESEIATVMAYFDGAVVEAEEKADKMPEGEALAEADTPRKEEPEEKINPDTETKETESVSGQLEEEAQPTPMPTPVPSREEFFRDTLFIGDSRTMGMAEYADIGDADAFANTGMNVYRLYHLENALMEGEDTLEEFLAKKQYRKIYFMLGINELGYDFDQTVKRYEEEILAIQEKQPEAEIILEANLHVTTARSEREEIFTNEGIDKMNDCIRQIAEKHGFCYIDVNEIFDDETGGLNEEYTHDQVHVLGKYYQQWADWIYQQGIAG